MTIVGRSQIDHPALGTAGGSALHAAIETIYTNIGNDLAGRYETAASVANSTLTTFTHNFGVQFADLKVLLYTGTFPNLTRVSDPAASNWTIAANGTNPKTQIDVTTPPSGGPHTFALMVTHGRGAEKLKDLDDVDFTVAPVDGQLFIYDSGTSKWEPAFLRYTAETAAIASNTITPTTGTTMQRITSGTGDIQMVAGPTAGKVYVLVNETGSDKTLKNDTGATAANRIYTGSGADLTLKNQAAVTLIYNSGLSRWVVAGGSGGGGLSPNSQNSSFTAAPGNNYLTDTSGGAITATLPAGTTGATIRFVDATESWGTNNLTITPASGEIIDMLAANESLICDVVRGWVELSWNGSRWAFSSLASTTVGEASSSSPGIVSIGTQTFAGAKSFNDITTFKSSSGANTTGFYDVNGAWTFGPTSNTPYTTYHTFYKNICTGTPGAATDINGGMYISANAFMATDRQPTRLTGLSGVALALIPRTNDANGVLQFYANQAADGATTSIDVMGEMTSTGIWTLGDGSLAATSSVLKLKKTNAVNNRLIEGIDAATRGYVRINSAQTNLEFEAASDRRIKTEIGTIQNALQKVMDLNPVTFRLKNGVVTSQGFIAQEFAQVFPQAVTATDDGLGDELPEGTEPWSMSDAVLIPYLVKAIQELTARIEQLEGN